ncbi:hypothetical protein ACFLV0_06855 [Chloroflexota bacterium]
MLEPRLENPTYSYDYMLNADKDEYDRIRREVIKIKAKQSLLLLSILKGAIEYEMQVYSDSWNKMKNIIYKSKAPFFAHVTYNTLRDAILGETCNIMKSIEFENEIKDFSSKLDLEHPKFEEFFNKLQSITPSQYLA